MMKKNKLDIYFDNNLLNNIVNNYLKKIIAIIFIFFINFNNFGYSFGILELNTYSKLNQDSRIYGICVLPGVLDQRASTYNNCYNLFNLYIDYHTFEKKIKTNFYLFNISIKPKEYRDSCLQDSQLGTFRLLNFNYSNTYEYYNKFLTIGLGYYNNISRNIIISSLPLLGVSSFKAGTENYKNLGQYQTDPATGFDLSIENRITFLNDYVDFNLNNNLESLFSKRRQTYFVNFGCELLIHLLTPPQELNSGNRIDLSFSYERNLLYINRLKQVNDIFMLSLNFRLDEYW